MTGFGRDEAVDRLEAIVTAVDEELMPVPVREVWVFGELALGLDPIERLDVYVTKDLVFDQDADAAAAFHESHGIQGVGQTVRAEWAHEHPEYLRANPNGYAAPEKCLAAHLVRDDEPIHLEVCNAGFESNVTQRLRGAMARETYEEILDPRGVALWVDGVQSEDAFEKLRTGGFTFPTLAGALEMLGLEGDDARTAAAAVKAHRAATSGASVRGDVV